MKQLASWLVLALLVGCSALPAVDFGSTYIVLWHTWDETEAQTLDTVLARFGVIFSDIRVISTFVPPTEIYERYQIAASQGLGPDVLIGPHEWVRDFADTALIRPLDGDAVDTSVYFASALALLQFEEDLYGLPLFMQPQAMYYNTALVDTPAPTLTALLEDAAAGQGVAINTRFADSLWGVQAFGGQILDDEGRVVLNQGGLTNWLNWLRTNSNAPGLFFGRDETTLRNLFVEERVAYYVGRANQLNAIRSELATVNVARLPDGPDGAAGPLLQVEALFLNPASSKQQAGAAITLAQFLTNIEQSTTFIRELDRVPANRRVRINANVYPAVSGFLSQIGTSVALPDVPQVDHLLREGDDAIIRVLEGILDPVDAATNITQAVNEAFGFPVVETNPPTCEREGEISLWHGFSGAAQAVLQDIVDAYVRDCPGVLIEQTYIPQVSAEIYLEALATNIAPDLVILDSSQLGNLVAADAIMTIPQDRLQPYLPQARRTVQHDAGTYGVPISLAFNVLYYNTALVSVPATTMDELLGRGSEAARLGIPLAFDQTFWALTAFGALRLANDAALQVDSAAVENWLAWLQAADADPQIVLNRSDLLLSRQFSEGNLGYVVSSANNVAVFEEALVADDGSTLVGVAPFPSDVGGGGQPLLHTDSFFITNNLDEKTQALALDFATFATNSENQMALLETARRVPANVNIVIPEDDLLLEMLMSQIPNTLVLPQSPVRETLLREGSPLYSRVLAGQLTPAEAAQRLADALIAAEATPSPD